MRVHWFSPLPPAHTGIAEFTRRLLPALSAKADVTLWTAQESWSYRLKHLAEVRRFDLRALPPDLRDGAIFYNIGNNSQFHAAIWEAARQSPGFAIMHDVFMHDSIAHSYQVRNDRQGYLQTMQSLYGPRGRQDAGFYWDGALGMPQIGRRYTCAPHILNASLGAIVHSRMAARTLRREVDLPIVQIPLPFPARRLSPIPHPLSPISLIVFGYLGSNRCLGQILTALANVPKPHTFHLHMYGDIQDRAAFSALVEGLGVQDLVTAHGFVPEAELDRELASAHLAINLRFPTKGEASYSQLRIWSHGLPSLVSRVGWYAELPANTVVFVRPDRLVEDLTEHLGQYAAAPERYIQAGIEGYRHLVEKHSPESYAAAIVEMAGAAGECRARRVAASLADRAAEGLAGWFDAGRMPEYAEHVASIVRQAVG